MIGSKPRIGTPVTDTCDIFEPLRWAILAPHLIRQLFSNLEAKRQAARGERNANYVRTATVALDNDDWGLVRHFATRDVRELKTRDWQLFIEKIAAQTT